MPTCPNCGTDNPDGFRFCGQCGTPLAETAPERRKTVTLLFCDVSGSTALGERLEAESVREVMLRYFEEMRVVIERHSGTVEKFVGDAVMAVFGVPVAHEDDALRAVRAASEMLERLEALNDEFEGRFGARIGLRIGINTGEVLAGDAGGGEGFVSGDAVNVAARLEQTAGVGEVLLGELTYRLARQAITAERVEPLTLKGKAKPVPAYRLVAVAPDGAARVGHAGTALVGREEELAALEQEFDAAVAAAGCRLVTILGEPGIGKSRLVAELLASVESEARILTGRCLSYGEGITYWALGEIVRRAAGIEKEDDAATARRRIESLLAGTEDAEVVAALIAQALGLERGSGATGEIAWAARRLFEALARERPLVVAIEDLHWAEQALVDLVEQLPALARGPILVVCLGRPEALDARPEWPGRVIRLEPLPDEDATLLIERLIGGAGLREDARERILEAAAGVPLFVEELLAILVEDGLVRQTPDGRWVPHGSLADFAIPPTIDALLAERLDRLEARQRTLLEDGAVEGQLFHLGAVLALAAESADRAARLLAELVQRELVRPSTPAFVDETAYRFRHILIRDAAYRALPKKTRGELHEQYARWLEQKAGGRETEYEEILGYHFEQAYHYRLELGLADDAARELGLRAGRLLAAAGRRALGRSDMAAAEGLLSRAVELLPADDPDRIERLLGLSVALRDLGAFERAAEVNAEAMERAAARGLRGVEARGRLNGGFLRLYTDPAGTDELVATAEAALPVFEELGDDAGLAQALWLIGVSDWNRCRGAHAKALAERALVHAERAGDRQWRDQILGLLGISALTGPDPVEEALERCAELVERARGARGAAALVNAYAASLEAMRGQFDAGREKAERSHSMLQDLGRRVTAAGACYFAAEVELLAGEPARAEEIARSAFDTLNALGETVNSAVVAAVLAEALVRQGRFDEAEALTETSERTAWPDDLHAQVGWRATRAQAVSGRGDAAGGERLAREALAMLDGADDLDLRGDALVALATTLAGPEREAAYREALGLYEAKGNLASADRVRGLLT
ncbi:MAG TPA: adenylate/guanylate cyclase domain-containing protein [Gaiellaceae bacterium]|jgi:class 3 adenylate cyclase|nr:adenylate/guanylate cyclase domain-containing protein [Gaiellaceae bacterium]